MPKNLIRKIESIVDISYGNEETGTVPVCSSSDKNPISNFPNLYNSTHTPQATAFTLEGNTVNELSANRGLVNPTITGWWSNSRSLTTGNAQDGYVFKSPPELTMSFAQPRPLKILELFGDIKLGEYPVKFNIQLLSDNSETVIYNKNFENSVIERRVNLITEGTSVQNETAPESRQNVENGYITGVKSIRVKILSWNKPGRVSKIYRLYDDIIERYEQDELKKIECVSELSNSNEIKFGLVSGSCTVSLLNNKGRKFDLGYLKNLAHINKCVIPYCNGEKMGTYFIKEWDISQDDTFVNCKANDRLLDFRDFIYQGCMPTESETVTTYGALFQRVLDFANRHYVKKFKYDIDSRLFEDSELMRVEPYLPRDSVWAVLQSLCEATLSFVFVDKNDVVCVRSELFGRDGIIPLELSAEINPDNAFAISIPFYADMEATRVEVPYYRKVVKEDQELFRMSGVSLNANETFRMTVEFDDYCLIDKIFVGQVEISKFDKNKVNDFKYELKFVSNFVFDKQNLIIKGTKITFEKQNNNDLDSSIGENAPSMYSHPNCQLIRNKNLSDKIIKQIMSLYRSGTRTVSTTWRGDQKLNLFDSCLVRDRFGGESKYFTTYIKSTLDGGLKQEVKGILTEKIKDGVYNFN